MLSQQFEIVYTAINTADTEDTASGTYTLTVNAVTSPFDMYAETVPEGDAVPPLSDFVNNLDESSETPPRYAIVPGIGNLSMVAVTLNENTGAFSPVIPFDTVSFEQEFQFFTFAWTFTDGSGTTSPNQPGTLNVTNLNQLPTIQVPGDAPELIFVGQDVIVALLGGDDDTNDDPPTWSVSSNDSDANTDATISQNGVFSWTPRDVHGGTGVQFTFDITDEEGIPATATHTFAVDPNNVPTFASYTERILEDAPIPSLSDAVTNPVETDADLVSTYNIASHNLPDDIRGSFDSATGDFSATFPFDTVSALEGSVTYEIEWTFEDGTGTSPMQYSTLTVDNDNRSPTIEPIPDTVPRTYSEFDVISFTVRGSDEDTNDPLPRWSVSDNATTDATIHLENGAFLWIPDESRGGSTIEFTFTLTDGEFEPTTTVIFTIDETEPTPGDGPQTFARYSQTVLEGPEHPVTLHRSQ